MKLHRILDGALVGAIEILDVNVTYDSLYDSDVDRKQCVPDISKQHSIAT